MEQENFVEKAQSMFRSYYLMEMNLCMELVNDRDIALKRIMELHFQEEAFNHLMEHVQTKEDFLNAVSDYVEHCMERSERLFNDFRGNGFYIDVLNDCDMLLLQLWTNLLLIPYDFYKSKQNALHCFRRKLDALPAGDE